jgi:hypothetical protein
LEEFVVSDEWVLILNGSSPEVGVLILITVGEGLEGSFDEVTLGSCGTTGGGVAILDTSELENLLGGGGGDDAGTSGGGDKSDSN